LRKKNKKSKKNKQEKLENLEEISISEETTDKNSITTNIEIKESISVSCPLKFNGSNLSEIYGYSPYNINCSIDALLIEKQKRANVKRSNTNKNLEIDADFYKMNKKKMCT
jgi:hypothetical protein